MDLSQIAMHARSLPLLAHLTPEEVTYFLQRCQVMQYARGTTVVREGDPGDSMLAVLDGVVRLTTTAQDGVAVELAMLGPGDVLGDMAVVDPGLRAATAMAESDTLVLVVGRDTLEDLVRHEPRLAAALLRPILQVLARRFRESDRRIEQIFDARLHVRPRAPSPRPKEP